MTHWAVAGMNLRGAALAGRGVAPGLMSARREAATAALATRAEVGPMTIKIVAQTAGAVCHWSFTHDDPPIRPQHVVNALTMVGRGRITDAGRAAATSDLPGAVRSGGPNLFRQHQSCCCGCQWLVGGSEESGERV